jgi:polyisoprenoid-binding protein YceI
VNPSPRPLRASLLFVPLLTLTAGLATAASSGSVTTWEIDPAHSSAQFAVRHMMLNKVRGEFGKLTGTLELDEKDLTRSSVQATVDAASINTREPNRDKHLRSADFFDVDKHPTLTFKSKQLKRESGRLKMLGDLTIRGVTREVVFDVEPGPGVVKGPHGNRRGASATTRINRKEFGLTWNRPIDAAGVLVSEEVEITVDVQLVQKSASPTKG